MPRKKNPESPEDQAKRFREEVQRRIDAGELSTTDADEALESLVRNARREPSKT
jgi:hypothetical protein